MKNRGHSSDETSRDRSESGLEQTEAPVNPEDLDLVSLLDVATIPEYVSDPVTYEILHTSKSLRELFGQPDGRKCYEYLQNRASPCPFCTNDRIFGENLGKSYVWEFNNELNQRWYRCIDKAIRWSDGRIVRYEMAVDITDLKDAETELKTSRDLLDATQKIAKVGGWEWDIAEQKMTWTDETYRIHGMVPGEFKVGSHEYIERSLSCYDPGDRERIWAAFQRCMDHHESYDIECPFTSVDGQRRWVHTTGRPVLDGSRVIKVMGNLVDITDRKQVEDNLRRSEEKFRNLSALLRLMCDNVPDMIWAKDLEKRYIFANKALSCNLLSALDPDEPIGKTDLYFAKRERANHPDDPSWHTFGELCRDSDQITMDAREPKQFDEFGNIQGKFIYLDVHKAPFLDKNGEMIGTVGSARDITEYRANEAARRESDEKYRILVENANDIVYSLTPEGVFTYVSPSWERILGHPIDEIVDHPFQMFVHPEDLPMCLDVVERIFRTNEHIEGIEYRAKHKDGSWRWHTTNASVLNTGSEKTRLFVGIARDITEHRQVEERMRQHQKAESLSRMAGAIAHHYNNLLATVMGNLELALDDLPGESTVRENLSEAMKAVLRAVEVSSLMLTYLGQTPSKHEPFNISEACHRSLPLLRTTMHDTVDIQADLASPGPTILANAHQFHQILINLLTNAWEALPEGKGSIRLTVKVVGSAAIPSAHRVPPDWHPVDTHYACLEVADNGIGIDKKDVDKLFDPFFSRKFTGRGLGLPVVLGILRAHGGAITVESETGSGSVFRVFFPLTPETDTHRTDTPYRVLKYKAGGTVLLVEDENSLRRVAQVVLERLGFSVLEACDGIEAIEIFQRHKSVIRFVICDLTMPRLDGWGTLTALRTIAPHIPVILASGYDEAHVMTGDHPEQPQAFLHKPYQLQGLREVIGMALKNEGGDRQANQ